MPEAYVDPQPPRVRAARVHADREVVHGAERHAGPDRLGLRLLELLVDDPLEPRLELDLAAVPLRERRDGGGVDVTQVLGPGAVVVAVLGGDHAPGREVAQRVTVPAPEGRQVLVATGAARRGVHDLQGGALRGPRGVAVDGVGVVEAGVHVRGQRLDGRARGGRQLGVLHDPLHPHVERVEEPARGRQVGGRLQRRDRLGGVQRVDQQEVGAELGGGPHGEVGQVDEVAHAPGLARPHAVQLRRETPGPAVADRLRQAEPRRGHDQHRVGHRVAGARTDAVVAERQVGGDRERRLTDRPVADRPRRHPPVHLGQVVAATAGLEVHATARPGRRR